MGCIAAKSNEAKGSFEGESTSVSARSIRSTDPGFTIVGVSIEPAIPTNTKIQKRNVRMLPATTASRQPRNTFRKFIILLINMIYCTNINKYF